jgi:hypothetical protein
MVFTVAEGHRSNSEHERVLAAVNTSLFSYEFGVKWS